ncbi:MAG: hypothetical protein KDD33_09185, partial [Bdellovibrionales bacterium]|nr:hypothetical protein [Bdellovibrionales bacterium]
MRYLAVSFLFHGMMLAGLFYSQAHSFTKKTPVQWLSFHQVAVKSEQRDILSKSKEPMKPRPTKQKMSPKSL